jgi:hypothetical protein
MFFSTVSSISLASTRRRVRVVGSKFRWDSNPMAFLPSLRRARIRHCIAQYADIKRSNPFVVPAFFARSACKRAFRASTSSASDIAKLKKNCYEMVCGDNLPQILKVVRSNSLSNSASFRELRDSRQLHAAYISNSCCCSLLVTTGSCDCDWDRDRDWSPCWHTSIPWT